MNSRRSRASKSPKNRAPRDPTASFEDAPEAPKKRSIWATLVLILKVGVGLSLIASAVGALAWGVHRYAQTTPRFAIVQVEIEGTRRLARDDVLAAAGFQKGDNLFALDIEEAEKKLLESPWISSARLTRHLPGTVNLEITERGAAALAIIGEKTFLVAEDGTPFKELGSGDPHDLALVTGLSVEALAKDRRAELDRLRDSLALLRDYEKTSAARAFPAQEVHLENSGEAVLVVGNEGISLHLGSHPWKRKLLRAERVLKKTQRSGGNPSVVFLDNDAHPERVVVRVR